MIARPEAPRVLAQELAARRYVPDVIAIGTNTDPYQPIEKDRGIMRAILQVLADHNHPVAIVTKGSLIERDVDIFAPMAEKGLVRVGMSITSLDPKVARAMEPRVPGPARKLRTIRVLSEAGIPVRLMVSPAFPDRAARVMGRVRELHGGQDYDPAFGQRMTGQGEWAKVIKQRFDLACKRLGLDQRPPALRTDLFKVPPKAGDQMDLFG